MSRAALAVVALTLALCGTALWMALGEHEASLLDAPP